MKTVREFFKIEQRGSSVRTEVFAGVTTFMTMSYIIFLQPLILSGELSGTSTGMPADALISGVCVAAAFGSILMGLLANYPIALAPGMGENFFFVAVISSCAALKISEPGTEWQTALGVVFLSGAIFLVLSMLNIRQLLLVSVSPSMKHAMAAGIGLFIALIGFKNSGLIHTVQGNYILNAEGLDSAASLIFFAGLIVTASLHVLKVRGSVLWGILSGAGIAFFLGQIEFKGIVGKPAGMGELFAGMDLVNVFSNIHKLLPFIIIFTFMDVFDTLGTLVGVATQSGLMKGNELPNSKRAFAADSIATLFGVFCGQSTVTSYIESSTGVEYGGRTGLAAVTSGMCFVLAVFFTPFIAMIGNYPGGINPITAPALVIVGAIMMRSVMKIDWDDFSEAVPSFLIIAGISFTFSISDGLMLGFVTYPAIKLFGGKARQIGWLNYVIGATLILYLLCVKTGFLEAWLSK